MSPLYTDVALVTLTSSIGISRRRKNTASSVKANKLAIPGKYTVAIRILFPPMILIVCKLKWKNFPLIPRRPRARACGGQSRGLGEASSSYGRQRQRLKSMAASPKVMELSTEGGLALGDSRPVYWVLHIQLYTYFVVVFSFLHRDFDLVLQWR